MGFKRAVLTGIGTNGNEQHPARLASGEAEGFPAEEMQNRNRNPEHQESEAANHAAEGVGKDGSPTGAGALWRTGKAFIQHLVESVEDATNADDKVAQESVLRLLVIFSCASFGDFLLWPITVCNYKHADDGYPHGKDLVEPEFLLEERDREGIGKERGAVVDGRQVTGCRQVDGDIP